MGLSTLKQIWVKFSMFQWNKKWKWNVWTAETVPFAISDLFFPHTNITRSQRYYQNEAEKWWENGFSALFFHISKFPVKAQQCFKFLLYTKKLFFKLSAWYKMGIWIQMSKFWVTGSKNNSMILHVASGLPKCQLLLWWIFKYFIQSRHFFSAKRKAVISEYLVFKVFSQEVEDCVLIPIL